MISVLSARLIIHHPYRTLLDLTQTFNMTAEENTLAHSIINDHYNTDLPFMYPPHVIAVTAIFLAIVLRPAQSGLQAHAATTSSGNFQNALQQGISAMGGNKSYGVKVTRLVEWLAESQIDMEAVIIATQELISLYEAWEGYSERVFKEAISRFMKDAMAK